MPVPKDTPHRSSPITHSRAEPRVLFVDPLTSAVATQLQQMRPLWRVVHTDDYRETLSLMHHAPVAYDLILIHVRTPHLRRNRFDGIMLTRLLTLHAKLAQSRVLVLLEEPSDSRDNPSALAAGASRALYYPKTAEDVFPLLIEALRQLFKPRRPLPTPTTSMWI
jgi:CheY-like chemotaxis protein